jgi:hypothetical protein
MHSIFVKLGDRVQLHPATDAWMRGDRFGTVVSLHPKRKFVRVKMDVSGKLLRVSFHNLLETVS